MVVDAERVCAAVDARVIGALSGPQTLTTTTSITVAFILRPSYGLSHDRSQVSI